MRASFKLLDNNNTISTNILKALEDTIDNSIKKALPKIKNRMQQELKSALMSEPEYQSLMSGKLKYEFGISSQEKIQKIIDIWIDNVLINYSGIKISRGGISATLSLDMVKSSYDDVLANDGAIVIDSLSGAVLPWLEWLLLYGGKIIVRDYKVRMGPNVRSRTGMAIMIESKGSNWRVPPEFAGTSSNNWVTRAIDKLDSKILDIMEQELEKAI